MGIRKRSRHLAIPHSMMRGPTNGMPSSADLTKDVVQWAQDRNLGLVIEDLHFVHDRDVSAKCNRVTHQAITICVILIKPDFAW